MNQPATPSDLEIVWSPAAASDAAELAEIFNTIAEADDLPERLSTESMKHELTSYFNPIADKTLVARDGSGTVVAYTTAYSRTAEADEMRAYVNVYVTPAWRNRGLEEALTDWAIGAGRLALSGIGARRRFVCAWLYNKQEEPAARLASLGFEPVRHWWEMERPLATEVAPPTADGFTIVPWSEDHDAVARLVYNEAFADHWGSTPMDAESWRKQVIASPAFRRDLSFVAIGDGEVVGYSACEEFPEDWEAAGQREAWVSGLGVIGEWRKRGIATALLSSSLLAMRNSGAEAAMIGVDAASPSGAQHLYQDLGFVTKSTGTTWQLEVD